MDVSRYTCPLVILHALIVRPRLIAGKAHFSCWWMTHGQS